MPKPLIDSKIFDFKGIQSNINPLSDRQSVISCKNLEPHVKPGKFTLRPPYQLTYPYPVDALDRINTPLAVSFDNFYEQTAADGVEVTTMVMSGQNQAPYKSGSITTRITNYVFNAVNIWIRPYWNGTYWQDSWFWLNETFITVLSAAPDATYKNKMEVEGYLGNLTQWTIVNITKGQNSPVAILRSDQNGTNTTIYTSNFTNNWALNDVVVLMRNYIPIKYLQNMYSVDKREISFHRLSSKMRIGFGGKYGRMALGVEYVNRTINMQDYSFSAVAPALVGAELPYVTCNRVIVQPYTQINEDKADFLLTLNNDLTGNLPDGTYYIKAVAKLDGFNAIQVADASIVVATGTNNAKILATFQVRSGSLSRRLTDVDFLYSSDGVAFYFWKTVKVTKDATVSGGVLKLQDNGYFSLTEQFSDINTVPSAVSAADINSLGPWVGVKCTDGLNNVLTNISVAAGSGDNYALKLVPTTDFGVVATCIPLDQLASPGIQQDVLNDYIVKVKATKACSMKVWLVCVLSDGTYLVCGSGSSFYNVTTALQTFTFSYATGSFDFTNLANYLAANVNSYGALLFSFGNPSGNFLAVSDYVLIDSISITPENLQGVISTTQLGALETTLYGYFPSYNIVRDWQCGVVINGQSYVGAGYVEKRYSQLVFFSPFAGDGSSMYDVLTSGNFLDSDKDNYRGESIIGMSILLNLTLIVFTENGAVVIDPSTGQTNEVARGHGLLSKDTLQKFRDTIYWGSPEDFVSIAASTGYEPQILSERSVRDLYNLMVDKSLAVACIDRYGSYHVSLGSTDTPKELMLTSRGWIDQDRTYHPVVMRNGFLGIVWFMDVNGNIYAVPQNQQTIVGYADIYGDYRSGW